MSTWLVHPRDPMVVRNARPMGEGGTMRSLLFPWPSTLAGFVRTRIGTDPATGRFCLSVADAKQIAVRGPWIAASDGAQGETFYVPAPRDVIIHRAAPAQPGDTSQVQRIRLSLPNTQDMLRPAEETDLPSTFALLAPMATPPRKKPEPGPVYWEWSQMTRWLDAPPATDVIQEAVLGLPALHRDRRSHVRIDPSTLTAAEGMLFSAEALCFAHGSGAAARPLSLAFVCDDVRLRATSGVATFGGERRISFFSPAVGGLRATPGPNVGVGAVVRVVLLTPAIFAQGSVPDHIGGLRVIAACVGRPESHSGWNADTGRPKATRKMAPAGSVYWLRADSDADAKQWAADHWLQCVSDDDQDKRDGFGLCVVGVP